MQNLTLHQLMRINYSSKRRQTQYKQFALYQVQAKYKLSAYFFLCVLSLDGSQYTQDFTNPS